MCAHLFIRRDGESSSRILLLQSKTHCFDWSDKLARSPQSAIFPPVSTLSLSSIHTPSPPPPSSPSFSPCAKDSRSRRQWWGAYQCEPECRLVPSPGRDTHKYRHAHVQIHLLSLLTSPLSIQCLCLCLYPCERYQAKVNNVLSTIDLSARSYGREREREMKREGSMLSCISHLHTVLYQPIRSLFFCAMMIIHQHLGFY